MLCHVAQDGALSIRDSCCFPENKFIPVSWFFDNIFLANTYFKLASLLGQNPEWSILWLSPLTVIK